MDSADIFHGFGRHSGQSPKSSGRLDNVHETKSKVQWTMFMGKLCKIQGTVDIVQSA